MFDNMFSHNSAANSIASNTSHILHIAKKTPIRFHSRLYYINFLLLWLIVCYCHYHKICKSLQVYIDFNSRASSGLHSHLNRYRHVIRFGINCVCCVRVCHLIPLDLIHSRTDYAPRGLFVWTSSLRTSVLCSWS